MRQETVVYEKIPWFPSTIQWLRGKRSRTEFAKLLGVSRGTISRWESRHYPPAARYARRLSKLAKRERFLADWKLVGSITWVGDLEEGSREISREFQRSLERTARFIANGG